MFYPVYPIRTQERLTATQALAHPWLCSDEDKLAASALSGVHLYYPYKPTLSIQ
jgi:hypothetical protein